MVVERQAEGVIEARRQRAECARCRISCFPAEDVLGLEAQERYSLGMAGAAQWLAVDGSYARSADSKLWAASAEDEEQHRLLGKLLLYVDANREGIRTTPATAPRARGHREDRRRGVWPPPQGQAKGTSWYRPGVHRLLSLRTLKQDRTWNRYWQVRRSRTPLLTALAG